MNLPKNTILNLLISYNLTFDEFYLVYLTFLARDEENHPEYFVKWFSNGGKSRLKDLFNSLKEKGIIKRVGTTRSGHWEINETKLSVLNVVKIQSRKT